MRRRRRTTRRINNINIHTYPFQFILLESLPAANSLRQKNILIKKIIKQILIVIFITDDDNFSLSSPHHSFYPPGTSLEPTMNPIKHYYVYLFKRNKLKQNKTKTNNRYRHFSV
jgi:hypothetical protein